MFVCSVWRGGAPYLLGRRINMDDHKSSYIAQGFVSVTLLGEHIDCSC
jgi:hypothetical protein